MRTTVRSLVRESEVRSALATVAPAASGSRLVFFAADLESDAGWRESAEGCRYVLHVASPLGLSAPRDAEVLIRPARDGALRALRAAAAAGAERFVMTSSVAAIGSGHGAGCYDETDWTDLNGKDLPAYAQSKTIAELAAWDFVGKAGGHMTLATVNPVSVVGPVMSADYSGSLSTVARLMNGRAPGIPNLGFCFVDVRDVADLHLRAMLRPEAGENVSSPTLGSSGSARSLRSCGRSSAPPRAKCQNGGCRTGWCGWSRFTTARSRTRLKGSLNAWNTTPAKRSACLAGAQGRRVRR